VTTIIAKNVSGGDIFLDDLGIDLATDSTTELNLIFSIYLISESSDLRDRVSNGDIVINDGNSDLSVSDGLDHLLLETEYEDNLSKRNAWDSQTNEPTPEDYGGWLDTDESILYSYNSTRDKWLSIDRRILTFHKEGEVFNGFMRIGGDLLTANNGYILERNATLIEAIARSTAGPTDANFRVFENSSNVYNFQFHGGLSVIDTTANVDLSEGAIIKCQALGGTQQRDWCYDEWSYRKKITIDSDEVSGSTTLDDFPVLIYINNSDLNKARADGFDILFALPTDSTTCLQLDHEIQFFNSSSGILWAWVRIPELSATEDTEIFVYYGNVDSTNQQNVSGVWSGGFQHVYHLEDMSDSVGGATLTDNNTAEATGKINNCREFDGNGDNLVNLSNSVNGYSAVTVSLWVNSDVQNTDKGYFFSTDPDGTDSVCSGRYDATGASGGGSNIQKFGITTGGGTHQLESSVNSQTTGWQYISWVWSSGNQLALYLDGSQDTPTNLNAAVSGTITGADRILIGRGGKDTGTGDSWDGLIDEVRISNVVRTGDWVATEYSNQNDPQNFYSVGDEQEKITTEPTENPLVQLTIAWRK
jgi:hypothetical protein